MAGPEAVELGAHVTDSTILVGYRAIGHMNIYS